MNCCVKIQDFVEESELHGVKHLSHRRGGVIRQLTWAVLIFVSVGFLLNNTIRQIMKYRAFEHVSRYDITYVHELGFPAITICNANRHRLSQLTKWDIVNMGPHMQFTDENFTLLHSSMYPDWWYTDMFNNTDWSEVISANAGKEYDIEDFWNRTGYSYDDFIRECYWKGQSCNKSAWTTQFTTYGKCYTFNQHNHYITNKPGAETGLKVILDIQPNEYLENHESEDLGIKFQAHNPIEPPVLKDKGMGFAPGYHYQIALQQREIKALPHPYGNCMEDSKLQYFKEYTLPACRKECESDWIYQNCSCRLVDGLGDHPVCSIKQVDCAEQVLDKIASGDLCMCHHPCSTVEYLPRTSSLQLTYRTAEKLAPKQSSTSMDETQKDHSHTKNLQNQLVVLNIFFDMMAFEKLEQTPAYTWLSIISDLGGSMGLWLGASFLAIFQLIEFAFRSCTTSLQKCIQGGSSKSKEDYNKDLSQSSGLRRQEEKLITVADLDDV